MLAFFRRISSISAFWILGILCIISFSLMLWASRTDSPIMDELAHVPAGYGYIHNLDYRLNPEHPPLIKALAMFPVLFLNPTFPTQGDAWQNQVNSEWSVGTQFLYQSGNNVMAIMHAARVMPILLTVLLIIFTYLFARGLMGDLWALLPATLTGFSPTILAHGHYVTTDTGAALGIIIAIYYFLKFVDAPSKRHLWYAGLSFGAAQLTKFSAPFLIPLFIFLAFVLWFRDILVRWRYTDKSRRFSFFFKTATRWTWRIILIFIIGYAIIVYPTYLIFTANYPMAKQVSDTQSILGSFAGGYPAAGAACSGLRCLAKLDIFMAHNPILRPLGEYLLGILMVMQRVTGGNTIYFLGHVVGSGGPLYFPIVFLLKEPLPSLAIIILALVLGLYWAIRPDPPGGRTRSRRILDYIGVNFAEFAMIVFIILYWGYSMHSNLNIGIRHVIPTIPFIYILSAGVWKKWVTKIYMPKGLQAGHISIAAIAAMTKSFARSFIKSALKYTLLIVLVMWLFFETIFAAPYFLSYFNELGGGTLGGYHFVTDSNYDWGQDLLRLRDWVNSRNAACPGGKPSSTCGVENIAVDYFGGGDPSYYLGSVETDWSGSNGNPAGRGIHWLAVSIDRLEGESNASGAYAWLGAVRPPAASTTLLGDVLGNSEMGDVPVPDARAGTSIFIYHL